MSKAFFRPVLQGLLVAVIAAAVIAIGTTLGAIFADPITLLGGVHKSDFDPYQTCASTRQTYIPEHDMANDKGCVTYGPSLRIFKAKEVSVRGPSFHTDLDLPTDGLLFVTAYASTKRDGEAPLSYVWAMIHVDSELCSSDDEGVTPPAFDGYSMHAAPACVMSLERGEHELVVERVTAGVKTAETRLSVRYVVLTQ